MLAHEKALGCLAGLAVGDALGMPTEFLNPEQIKAEFGTVRKFQPAPSWHPHARLKTGSVTDDTHQTLAVARAYSPNGTLGAEDMARELLAWADSTPADDLDVIIGRSTRTALAQIRAGVAPSESGKSGQTNGAAMRVAPVGLMHAGNPLASLLDVVQASMPTHFTTQAISGAAAVAFAVAEAAGSAPTLEGILNAAMLGAREGRAYGNWCWGTPLEKRIELALDLVEKASGEPSALHALYNYVGVDMLVAESVACAFGLIKLADGNLEKVLTLAANIGGDTDTIASITGAVCGAWHGIAAVPGILLNAVEETNNLDLASVAHRLVELNAKNA